MACQGHDMGDGVIVQPPTSLCNFAHRKGEWNQGGEALQIRTADMLRKDAVVLLQAS